MCTNSYDKLAEIPARVIFVKLKLIYIYIIIVEYRPYAIISFQKQCHCDLIIFSLIST